MRGRPGRRISFRSGSFVGTNFRSGDAVRGNAVGGNAVGKGPRGSTLRSGRKASRSSATAISWAQSVGSSTHRRGLAPPRSSPGLLLPRRAEILRAAFDEPPIHLTHPNRMDDLPSWTTNL